MKKISVCSRLVISLGYAPFNCVIVELPDLVIFIMLQGIAQPPLQVQGNPGYHSSATPGGCIAQGRQGSCPTPAPVLPNGGFGVAQYQGVRLRNTGGRGCPIQGVGVAQPRG
ncbi:MAG: hypothetical protein RIF36_17130 [Imperialibacter sp.]|uniref:hypothetical protein n=1 Tax=Imperialibacter sp. TaxID=2038411 RepID=UPI0032EC5E71